MLRILRLRFAAASLCLLTLSAAMLAQSCSTSKKCGCGADLNRVYRAPRR